MNLNVRLLATIPATLLGLLATAGPAVAGPLDGGDETPDGFGVGVSQVTVSGDVSGPLRASVPAPPPLCYWRPVSWPGVDASDPKAVKKYYQEFLRPYFTSSTAAGGYYAFPNGDASFQEAIEAAKGGPITWYTLEIDNSQLPGFGGDSADSYQERVRRLNAAGCGSGMREVSDYIGGLALVTYNYFPAGNPPAPVVDVEALAEYAYSVMDLVEPTLEWNPKIAANDNASLVNLPTWMWVDEQAAVAERSVTASLGALSATVTATTDGLSITSPAGTTECSSEEAATSYASGVEEASACTMSFSRASYGYGAGFPVAASSVWQAEWTSTIGEGGTLESRTAEATTDIPVVESQSLVTSVD